jgi:hypothetical protein
MIQGKTSQSPSPVESPISVTEYFPCGQVKPPLDYRPLYQDKNTTSGH